MAYFLDARSLSDAPRSGSIKIKLGSSPQLFGRIGMGFSSSVEDTVIMVCGAIGLTGDEEDTFTIHVVRGESYNPANVIYMMQGTVADSGFSEMISFHVHDFSVPAVPSIVYTAYISGEPTTFRSGPELFFGVASLS
ncbi:hypothetical protein [Paenibacillus sp. FSL E2-0178]|uniref:hypothetical protein n=1 Tax=Paenibacillus sp. FSL E2-0178 TaxID=2921361 RepID=UPI003159155F